MKKYYKTVISLGILYFLALLAFTVFTGGVSTRIPGRDTDIIKLNDITKDAGASFHDLNELSAGDYGVDFAILDTADNLLYASFPTDGKDISIAYAIKNGLAYSYVTVNGKVSGYVILRDDSRSRLYHTRLKLITGLTLFGILLIVSAVLFGKYIEKNIIIPFDNMKDFASDIAGGRLDTPLAMDKGNMFGAFTESFDIMREELTASKKREIELQRRERELIASLSHDLKTPVTGIKVTSELLKAKLNAGGDTPVNPSDLSEKIDNIYRKADQIDKLVSDLFSSTMEELDELKVNCIDESSLLLHDIIKKYDDRELVTSEEIPKILIHIDARRLSQVIGNIISNSYKYAGTGIEVSYRPVDDYLEMKIRDHGPGVPEDELSLITNKFYRGRDWAGSREEGSGLGLYIAKMLMEKMDGELLAENAGEGLLITLMIPLSH
ncbi:MAG: HAMP domain-containing histidine kinase [Lachnospiraceae bacterium]|nr:HAMP domain-containing histidine kinase [Lachnospiraceae bacterium]